MFLKTENEQFSNSTDDNGKLRVEVIIVTFFNAVATVDVLTASNKTLILSKLKLYIWHDY